MSASAAVAGRETWGWTRRGTKSDIPVCAAVTPRNREQAVEGTMQATWRWAAVAVVAGVAFALGFAVGRAPSAAGMAPTIEAPRL
jgi:hypothetical protein